MQEKDTLASRALQHHYVSTARQALHTWMNVLRRNQKLRTQEHAACKHQVASLLHRAMTAWQAGMHYRQRKRVANEQWCRQTLLRRFSLWRIHASEQRRWTAQTRLVRTELLQQCFMTMQAAASS